MTTAPQTVVDFIVETGTVPFHSGGRIIAHLIRPDISATVCGRLRLEAGDHNGYPKMLPEEETVTVRMPTCQVCIGVAEGTWRP